MSARRRGRFAALACMALASGARAADPPAPPPFTLEISAGHETLSSPVVRIDPDTALLRVDGDSRLRGAYGRVAANGFTEWRLGAEATLVATTRVDAKVAPGARELDFALAQADLTLRIPVAGFSLGAGPSLGHVRVAGERFRDAAGWRFDVARGDGADGHWVLVADGGPQRHGPGFEDLDARAASVSLHRRIASPLAGIAAFEVEGGLSRHRNRHGYRDLSHRGDYVRVAAEAPWRGLDASLAVSVQRARFDDALIDGMPARRDRFAIAELGISKDLGPDGGIKLDLAWGRNRANVAAFDHRLFSAAVAWIRPF